jgi:hypothetical protein
MVDVRNTYIILVGKSLENDPMENLEGEKIRWILGT